MVFTLANVRAAPSCQLLTVPERSAQKSLPSGAKASAVAKLAAIFPLGGACPCTAQASLLACTLGDGLGLAVTALLARTLGDGLGLAVGADEHALSRISMPAIQARNKR